MISITVASNPALGSILISPMLQEATSSWLHLWYHWVLQSVLHPANHPEILLYLDKVPRAHNEWRQWKPISHYFLECNYLNMVDAENS